MYVCRIFQSKENGSFSVLQSDEFLHEIIEPLQGPPDFVITAGSQRLLFLTKRGKDERAKLENTSHLKTDLHWCNQRGSRISRVVWLI